MTPQAQAIPLDFGDLAIAAILVLFAGGISLLLKLRLEKQLLIASLRTVVQLLLIGYLLRYVFGIDNPVPLLIIVLLMVTAATYSAIRRPSLKIAGSFWRTYITLAISGILITTITTQLIIKVEPWYNPRYVIPLLGMVVGNTMTAISLSLDYLLESFSRRKDSIETDLALGATSWEAAREPIAEAVSRGMIPIINAMMVVGLVTLPGMMTGQILAGADPLNAVKYQIIVMFMLAASTGLASIITSLLVFRRVFNSKHQLRSELIHSNK